MIDIAKFQGIYKTIPKSYHKQWLHDCILVSQVDIWTKLSLYICSLLSYLVAVPLSVIRNKSASMAKL